MQIRKEITGRLPKKLLAYGLIDKGYYKPLTGKGNVLIGTFPLRKKVRGKNMAGKYEEIVRCSFVINHRVRYAR